MFSDNVDDGAEPAPVPAVTLTVEKITIPMERFEAPGHILRIEAREYRRRQDQFNSRYCASLPSRPDC